MNSPFPPNNYVPTSSSIAGIEIYMPAPEEEAEERAVVNFDCPQCGGVTAYNTVEGGLKCSHCGYYEAPDKEVVGKQAVELEFTVETMERSAQGWGEARNEMECQQCGARTSLPIENLTYTCAFCGSNKVIQRRAPQDIIRPRYLIPFNIQSDACQKITQQWLGSSWMTPSGLQKIGSRVPFSAVYIPFWTFDARTTASWRAEVGHVERERYFQDGEWKERTVIKWRWESGNTNLQIDDMVIEGTARLSPLLLDKIRDYRMEALVAYEPKYLAGLQAQAYDIPLDEAWKRGREKMREQTRQACLEGASTDMVRNFSMSMDFADESWRYILLPMYLSAFNHQGKPYQVMINGQTGAISGQRPVDWTRVWLVILALLSPGLFLGFIGLITIAFGGVGMVIGGFGFVLLIIGLVLGFIILREAHSMDDA